MRMRSLLAAAVFACPALAAHAEGVDLKPGLWERTVTMQIRGATTPDLPELDSLPPEQRAQLEQALVAMSGKPTVERECVTPDMLKRWEDFSQGEGDPSCTRTVQQQTPKRVVMSLTCDGGKMTGTMDFAAPSPERLTGSVSMRSTREDTPRSMDMKLDSRWLGADCGSVKPRGADGTR